MVGRQVLESVVTRQSAGGLPPPFSHTFDFPGLLDPLRPLAHDRLAAVHTQLKKSEVLHRL